MWNYKLIKVIIDTFVLVQVIYYMVLQYYNLFDSVVTHQGLGFILKFWSSLSHFMRIKKQLSIYFYPQTKPEIRRLNNTMKVFLGILINGEKEHWLTVILIVEFGYDDIKDANTGYILSWKMDFILVPYTK